MRLFLAVFPPREVQEAAYALGQKLRQPDDPVSWVKPENLHYTLRFMGELGEDGARRVGEAALEAASQNLKFEASLGKLGAFPGPRRARVIWIGMTDGAEALQRLARTVETQLRRRKFSHADKPFSAHLTIGRVRLRRDRGPAPKASSGDWTERLEKTHFPASAPCRFKVDRLLLMESKLSPQGSTYTQRIEAELT